MTSVKFKSKARKAMDPPRGTPRYATLRHATPRYATLRHATPRYANQTATPIKQAESSVSFARKNKRRNAWWHVLWHVLRQT
jgi:hypothetical protein